MESINFVPGDRVQCRHADYQNRFGVSLEVRDNRRYKEYLIRFDGDNEEVWISARHLWRVNQANEGGNSVEVPVAPVSADSEPDSDDSDDDSSGSSSDSESAGSDTGAGNLNPPPPQAQGVLGGRGHPGRGGGGRGRGRGRGQQVNPNPNPPVPNIPPEPAEPPNLLHIKTSKSGPATYQDWTNVPDVGVDPANNQYNRRPTLSWTSLFADLGNAALRTELDYFKLMFPMDLLPSIVENTNTQLRAKRLSYQVTPGVILKYFGIRLAIALNRCNGKLEDFWKSTEDWEDWRLFDPPDFGSKFGMSLKMFQAINSCFRLTEFVDDQVGQDPYLPITAFLRGFNDRREQMVIPGKYLVVDECMCSWKGLEMFWSATMQDSVHITKIKRKPKGIGIEIKCSADGESGIMLRLEIQKGANAPPEEFEDSMPFHSAITARLVKPWFGTGRIVIGDAAFSSLRTVIELLKKGLYYLGVLKQCTWGFPKKYLDQWAASVQDAGRHCVVTTNVDIHGGQKLVMGVAWKAKKNMHRTLIGSALTTLAGSPHKMMRTRKEQEEGVYVRRRVEIATNRPVMAEKLFEYFNTIDMHDRLRQGCLQMEVQWRTDKWWLRLFTTMLGIIYTDAYLAYQYEFNHFRHAMDGRKANIFEFLERLAKALIACDNQSRELRRPRIDPQDVTDTMVSIANILQ